MMTPLGLPAAMATHARGSQPVACARDAGRDDDDAYTRPPSHTRPPNDARSTRSNDGWDDLRLPRDERPSRDDHARSGRDRRDAEPERPARRHGSSAGAPGRDARVTRNVRDDGGRGPRGWDDHGWDDDGGWDQGAWDGASWDAADNRAHSGRSGRGSRGRADSDVWQPASQRGQGAQGRGMAARAGAAWRDATSQFAAVVKRPSSLRERLRTDKKARIIAIVMLVVIFVCLIPTPILAYSNTMSVAKDGIAHLKNAENDFKALASSPTNLAVINDAQNELQLAHNDFAQLQPRVALLGPLGFIPKVGSKAAGASMLVPLAANGTQAGVLACDAMKVLVTGLKDPLGGTGGLSSADMTRVASDMDQIHALYGQMEPILANLTQADLSLDPGLWPTVSSLQARLPQVTQLMNDMDGAAHALPQLLGVGKPSTYLVLVLDSSELRPTGGFIGNFGALSLNAGKLDPNFHISDITLIDGSVKFPRDMAKERFPLSTIPSPSRTNIAGSRRFSPLGQRIAGPCATRTLILTIRRRRTMR